MDTQAEVKRIQSLLLDLISSALSKRDVVALAALSGFIKEYETLVEAAKNTLNGSRSTSTIPPNPTHSGEEAPTISRKAAGAQARTEWVASLQGISLLGHGTRYQTARGRSVAVAFAKELMDNRWFLGLPDKPPEVAVLLCESHAGKLHDIVLPASLLIEVWPFLSKSRSGVKFNIRKKDAGRFLLLLTGNKPRDVSTYVGNYDPLR